MPRAYGPQLLKTRRLEPVLGNKRSHNSENLVNHNWRVDTLAETRESLCAATKIQVQPKIKKKKIVRSF